MKSPDKNSIEPEIKNTIVDLFFLQVDRTPNEIAVVYKEQELTYSELNILSNQLAHYLISEQGVMVGDFVGIMQSRSEMLIVCILGILKSGAAYVPIDPDYPQQRIDFLQNDSNCKFTLDHSALNNFLVFKEKYDIKAPSAVSLKPNDLAYIIYTSGSTGNPKGVMIEHRNLLHYLFSVSDYIDTNSSNSGCFAHLSQSFDASILDIFLPLIFGKKLILSSGTGVEIFDDKNLFKYAPYDFLNLTPSHISILISVINKETQPKLTNKYIIGGEALYNYHINQFKSAGIDATIVNEYGPTEATVGCITYEFNTFDTTISSESIPIGKPMSNTQIYVLDENRQLTPEGEIGEIYIAGNGIARGYYNREDLTSEKFVLNPFDTDTRMYRTGDLAKWLPDGNLLYFGRLDEQVKINGHRIELGEIEAALIAIPQIKLATVVMSTHFDSEPRLVAYLQPTNSSDKHPNVYEELSKIVPVFMIPNIFMWVDDFPLTTNGKIDKKSLPTPEYIRPDSAPILRKPRTAIEKEIAKVWIEELKLPVVGIDDNFFEMGGTSFLTQRVVTVLRKNSNLNLSVSTVYRHPTIARLAEHLATQNNSHTVIDYSQNKNEKSTKDVAIIGMAGRFPGAASIEELWKVLKEGEETISFFKSDEIDVSIPESVRNNPFYVGARGIVPSAKTFDAAFFGINPKLAEVMDPQQRLFLEISWEALEQAGYLPKHFMGRIGVYAGAGTNTYYKNNILPNDQILDDVGDLNAETVNEKDYISTRTSYHLNLKGPSVSVHSACSTSLLAISQAVQAIRNGQCDIALAGASSITAPINSGHLYEEGSMLSSDGHCRAFDAAGKGTVFSDGAGVVLLKSLESAINDGDKIYGIIKGIGISNDGGNKGSFTAPSAEGQAAAISAALYDARVTPDSISYVETHGTATPIGDPIEIEGLKIAYGKQSKNGYCAIGSIKTNMGHLTAAAGVAGLIKTILAMNNKLIPASLGFDKPNPAIDFENSPFYVNAKLSNWESDAPLRAGVSSFGVGGTNVHLIVEEYPIEQKVSSSSRPLQLLMWSAKSENSLKGYATELGKFVQSKPDLSLADIAYSLNKTRDTFAHRGFLVSSNSVEASQELLSNEKNTIKTSVLKVAPNEIAFLFPGQGSQFSQMGMNLYKNETIYKEAVDTCAEFLLEELKLDIREILYPEIVTPETEAKLKDTRFTQPALFVTEYALSQLWLSWGIKPTAYCGHSIGEFVAAQLAGIFSLQDALHLIATRGRLVSELPGGSMLSVRLAEDKLKNILPDTLSIAAINSNAMCVVSGEDEKVNEFAKSLEQMEIANKLLFTSHAFHSKMMNPILDTFEKEVKKIHLNKPFLPIVSTVTGTWLLDDEAIDPKYWTNHLRNTVRFADAANTLLKLEDIMFIEVGPGQTLTALTKQQGAGKIIPAFTSLNLPKNQETEYHSVLNTLGELWLRGINIDWNSFYHQQQRLKIDLPSYVFDRKLCWIDPINVVKKPKVINLSPVSDVLIVSASSDNNSVKTKDSKKDVILFKISEIIKNVSGIIYEKDAASNTFLELGLDSLALTQLAGRLKKEFDLPITFRQLNEAFSSPSLLADYISINSAEVNLFDIAKEEDIISNKNNESFSLKNSIDLSSNQNQMTLEQIDQQIHLLSQQRDLLQNQQNNSINETFSSAGFQTETLLSTELNNENRVEPNGASKPEKIEKVMVDESPVPGARLGRDEDGNPAWFVEDSSKKGEYIKINL